MPEDVAVLLAQVEKEYDEIREKTFWKDYIKGIEKERDIARGHCERDKEDVRFHQGQIRAIDAILSLPKLLLEQYRRKRAAQQGP